MKTLKVKLIEISGYTSANKTALWDGSRIDVVTDYIAEDYSFSNEDIDKELKNCQNYIDKKTKELDWVSGIIAFISEFKIEVDE